MQDFELPMNYNVILYYYIVKISIVKFIIIYKYDFIEYYFKNNISNKFNFKKIYIKMLIDKKIA